ncbi:response regulator transcription factor [Rheinheimera sp. UJ51]|uniref:response regulator transcription factor n=1 Tax=Rheinheimera sp. UJ51 TaxID=2892446 RepID=UPI001E62B2F8|nr:response regulator transcription factor [Rheinheimera sp. UJ51]MCC5452264.1 response regulator transcription factor [Rheinheimera sp. UJ51]
MEASQSTRLLLIEDDLPLAELTLSYLQQQGFNVQHISQAELISQIPQSVGFDLIICDVMLPGVSGFEASSWLTLRFNCPILFLTALDEDHQQIKGLELGACDYIVKPVKPTVLLARINANLRKMSTLNRHELRLADLTINRLTHQLSVQDKSVKLTTKELALLWIFACHNGQVLHREFLFEQLVGREYNGLDRTIDVKISRLRTKLQQLDIIGLDITTLVSQGYLFHYDPRTNR